MRKLIIFVCGLMHACLTQAQDLDAIAYQQIEKRQRKFGAKEVTISLDSQKADYIRRYNAVAKGISEKVSAELNVSRTQYPKTKYETIVQRTHIYDIQKRAYSVLKRYGIDTSSVYFSFVVSPCFQAQSIKLEYLEKQLKNRWLIEYNLGFSIFAQKVGVFSANISPPTGNLDSLSLDPQQYAEFLLDPNNTNYYNNLFAFFLGDIASALNIESDSITLETCKNPVLAGAISAGFSAFTLYHELAHIILNHHARINKLSVTQGEEKVEIANYYNYEYAADSLGLVILLSEMADDIKIYKEIPSSSISGPYILAPLVFFSWLNHFQKFQTLITGTYRGKQTHPPADERRMELLKQYEFHQLSTDVHNYADLLHGSLRLMYDVIQNTVKDSGTDSIKKLRSRAKICLIE